MSREMKVVRRKKQGKKWWKILLGVIAGLLAIVIIYVAYVFISYNRIEDRQTVEVIGKSAADVTIVDALHHLVLPALTLSVVGVANIAMHTREKAIDVMESDYIRFARARGLTPWQALRAHGLRNLLLPAITLQFASISEIFGGSVLVEQVFSYPGLGQAAVTAGLGSDVALLAAIAVFSAALVFAGNLIANILYGVVDPRIRKGEGSHV